MVCVRTHPGVTCDSTLCFTRSAAGTWYTVSFNSKLRNHWISMGNTTLLYATDNGNYQTWGAPGMYIGARSRAVFDDFIADSDCDTGMNARWMFEGMQLIMTW